VIQLNIISQLNASRIAKPIRATWWKMRRGIIRRGSAFTFELTKHNYLQKKGRASFPQEYSARYVTRDEIPALAAMTGASEVEYFRRFDSGDRCFGVFHGLKPANINWIHLGACYVRGLGYIHPGKERDAYIYGILTEPAERGKGLYKNALINLADELYHSDVELLVQLVESSNAPVLHTLPQLGYIKTTRISHLHVCGVKCTEIHDLANGATKRRIYKNPPGGLFII
jgi:hypothetical protein